MPRFDLLKVDRYRTLTIQFARGCPYTCEFYTSRRLETLIQEIRTSLPVV